MNSVDWPASPLEASMKAMPASSKSRLRAIGLRRYFSIWFSYGSMLCNPSAAFLLIAHSMS